MVCLASRSMGKARFVHRPEIQREQFGEIQRSLDRCGALRRMQQRMLDGKRHRRRRELREHGAVVELDEAVHDALGVEDGLTLVMAQAEEALGLDEFEALVGERGGIDGDLGAHRPIGVLDGIGRSDVREFFQRPVPERAATGGEDDAPHAGLRVALHALKNGAVLAVHRG